MIGMIVCIVLSIIFVQLEPPEKRTKDRYIIQIGVALAGYFMVIGILRIIGLY